MHQVLYTILGYTIFLLALTLSFTMEGGQIIPPHHRHMASAIPAIPPVDYAYDTHALDSVIPPLPIEEEAKIYTRGQK